MVEVEVEEQFVEVMNPESFKRGEDINFYITYTYVIFYTVYELQVHRHIRVYFAGLVFSILNKKMIYSVYYFNTPCNL